MAAKVIQLSDYMPDYVMRKFDKDELAEQMSHAQIFNAEMEATDKIADQDERIEALRLAWDKFQNARTYNTWE